jgi:inorganic pyrophosphatase
MGFSAVDAVIPACAVIGIAFAAWQWFLVAKVKVSAYASAGNGGHGRPVFRQEDEEEEDTRIGGESDDEEDGGDGPVAVARCAEIQNAISVGEFDSYYS